MKLAQRRALSYPNIDFLEIASRSNGSCCLMINKVAIHQLNCIIWQAESLELMWESSRFECIKCFLEMHEQTSNVFLPKVWLIHICNLQCSRLAAGKLQKIKLITLEKTNAFEIGVQLILLKYFWSSFWQLNYIYQKLDSYYVKLRLDLRVIHKYLVKKLFFFPVIESWINKCSMHDSLLLLHITHNQLIKCTELITSAIWLVTSY